ncbi:hypothetical protein [Vitiosangium sp. GDMCC 1.1324]|uniref:hypothetical protein n=1 Tax=Vitiosangium sp. (strain GDMCC 1.1324) TaxID=2138576 RepID=UPI000D39A40C|nr:hypothetical protein [Vitiosangium sp. GDMCC 1.1324]PTL80600.1 hypothetical protein DAT35_28650 [Vitiosangium sp. GDMCC 1.1324]
MTKLDSVPEDVRWRQALYGGLLGSAGVVLAWMVWVVLQAWFQDWVSVVRAPAVGASLGIVVDFLSEHVRASAREARGEHEPSESSPPAGTVSSRSRRVLKAIGVFSLVFLAGACENLVGDRLASLWRPFLVSVATFFPVGAVFAWMLHARDFSSHSLPSNLFHGVFAGLCAATTVVGMGLVLGTLPRGEEGVDWSAILALLGWWGLLGGAFGFALREEDSPSLLGPPVGVGCMLVLTLLGAVPVSWFSDTPGPVGLLARAARPVSALVLTHPGLPAQVLADVETASGPAPLTPSPGGSGGVLRAAPAPEWSLRVTRLLGCEALVATPGPLRVVRWSELSPRHQILCNDLRRGSHSGLLRSWLVLLVFSLGLGLAHVVEAHLRPATYAGSATQGRDGVLAVGAGVLLLAAVLFVRFIPL